MDTIKKTFLIFIIFCFASLYAKHSFLHTKGTLIFDEAGEQVNLGGINLGNWLLLEMWMLEWNGRFHDQYELFQYMITNFGKDKQEELMAIYRDNYIRERDFKIIKSFGMNVVRIPFHYSVLEEYEFNTGFKSNAFRWFDRAIEWGRKYGIYVILDMHGAPSGQTIDHTDGRSVENDLWTKKEAQDSMVRIWEAIAKRYKDEPVVAGYDLVNEPWGDFSTRKHFPMLKKICQRLYYAIRATGDNHIIYFAGGVPGSGLLDTHGIIKKELKNPTNVGLTQHYYPGLFGSPETIQSHSRFISLDLPAIERQVNTQDIPFMVGEFNVSVTSSGGRFVLRRYFDEYLKRGWVATMWSYKILRPWPGWGGDSEWWIVKNKAENPHPDFDKPSYKKIKKYFERTGTMRYSIDKRLRKALTMRKPTPAPIVAYQSFIDAPLAVDALPAGWLAKDIDKSAPGGQKVISPTEMEIYGGGKDIFSDADQFRYVYQSAPQGNFTFSTTIHSLEEVSIYTKGGIMLRENNQPGSRHILIHAFPSGEVVPAWRPRANEKTEEKRHFFYCNFPIFLKLKRQGKTIIASASNDGETWRDFVFPLKISTSGWKVGLAVLSHDGGNHVLTTAKFSDISIK